MLSYRHAYHAGNHADILKHFMLYLAFDYFNRKDKPYWYIDTHSGAGLYDLHGEEAQKVGEYRQGIGCLADAAELPDALAAFAGRLKTILPRNGLYCGSPWLAQAETRSCDKLRLFERHPADFAHLARNMQAAGTGRRATVSQSDGWQALAALLPPPTRRAIVLIDPPYEEKQDYARALQALKDAAKRFPGGCYLLWYPCLSREESRKLPAQLIRQFPDNRLLAELHVRRPGADGFGMHGSGMFVINPPYVMSDQLKQNLPALTSLLAQDDGAHFSLDCRIL